MKKIRNLVLILTLFICFNGCDREQVPELPVQSVSLFTVEQAEAWFGSEMARTMSLKSGNIEKAQIGIKPDWCNGFTSQNNEVEVVEVGLLVQGRFNIADEASYQNWEKTKNQKMISSLTRMVFLKYKKDGRIDQFLMTVVGDKEYHDNKFGRLSDNSYLTREKHFSGRIYYHDLAGNFVNGWIYEKGKLEGKTNQNSGKGLSTELKMATTCITTNVYTTYVVCTDWYADTNANGSYDEGTDQFNYTTCGDSYTLMASFTECPVYFTGSGNISTTYVTDTGGTNGGYDPSQAPTPVVKKYENILNHNYLNITQTILLESALNNLINSYCLAQTLYNSLVNRGSKLNFTMGGNYPALYNPWNKTISFNANSTITSETLKEELFHALQDSYYSGGTSQYTTTGKVNIEFEAKLFKDVMVCCGAFNIGNAPSNINGDYSLWVLDLGGDPSKITYSDYQKWLGLFNQYTPEYASPVSPNLNSPSLLKSLMLNCLN